MRGGPGSAGPRRLSGRPGPGRRGPVLKGPGGAAGGRLGVPEGSPVRLPGVGGRLDGRRRLSRLLTFGLAVHGTVLEAERTLAKV